MKKFNLFILFLLFTISSFAQHGVVKSAGAMSEMGKTGFAPNISLELSMSAMIWMPFMWSKKFRMEQAIRSI
jgi:hypothetical protein